MPAIKKKTIRHLAEMKSVSNFVSLKSLIYLREQVEITSITKKLKNLVLEKKLPFFKVWTEMLNDDIQNLALAFGERYALQNAFITMEDDCIH